MESVLSCWSHISPSPVNLNLVTDALVEIPRQSLATKTGISFQNEIALTLLP
jgi:hypothetical protein